MSQRKCTCGNKGTCGYCPSIGVTAYGQGRVKGSDTDRVTQQGIFNLRAKASRR